jgi:glycosyltransferase involved in cell wall biosynthesis
MTRIAFLYDPIAFGAHRPPIDIHAFESRPMTGTDLVSVRLPIEMARRGHTVTLFMDRAACDIREGLRVWPFSMWADRAADYDVVVATSNPNALEHARPDALRMVNRQVATFGVDCKPGWERWTDLVVCPSKWARDLVRGALGDDAPRFDVLRSGCDLPDLGAEKVHGRCVYVSSPDRGLHWVLAAWGRIRQHAPHATLRIMYESIGSWLKDATKPGRAPHNALDAEQIRRAHYIAEALERLKPHGVECVPGGLSHAELQSELAQAEALLYPLDPLAPTETFGIAVLESQSHGVIPVLSDADAFGELWGPSSVTVPAPVGENLGTWTANAVSILTDATYRAERSAAARRNAEGYTWGASAEHLERILAEGLERKRAPVVELVRPEALTIHAVLTPYASGDVKIAPHNPYEASTGGGCRTGFVQLTRGLAALGHRVRAFSTWTEPDIVEGVQHLPLADVERLGVPDAIIGYYDTTPVRHAARVTVAMHHTYAVPFPASVTLADLNTAPSEHAMAAVRGCYGGRGWFAVPNIIPPNLPSWAPVRGRVLYHTSADRGLHVLIRAWPEVRRRVPCATLHVVGDVEGWATRMQGERCAQGDRARALLRALPAAVDAGGLEMLGRLSRGGVHRELREAACVALPFDPPAPCETWSTSIAEACAVGVPVVLAPCDALAELWSESVVMVPSIGGDLRDFVHAIEQVLTEERLAQHVSERELRAVAPFTAENAARVLDGAIREALRGKGKVAA